MLILASGSPRRKELLQKLTKDFTVIVPNVDEKIFPWTPDVAASESAKMKAYAVFASHPFDAVLSCDTVVLLEGNILGKPRDEEEAFAMLKAESGKMQKVLSAYCYLSGDIEICRTVMTRVYFNELSDELIRDYIQNKKPLDKAGAYGIQDGYPLVHHIEGSYDNVVGLPTEDIARHIKF